MVRWCNLIELIFRDIFRCSIYKTAKNSFRQLPSSLARVSFYNQRFDKSKITCTPKVAPTLLRSVALNVRGLWYLSMLKVFLTMVQYVLMNVGVEIGTEVKMCLLTSKGNTKHEEGAVLLIYVV